MDLITPDDDVLDNDDIEPISNIERMRSLPSPSPEQLQAIEQAEHTGDWSGCMDAIGCEMAIVAADKPKPYSQRGKVALKVDISSVSAKLEKIDELRRLFWWQGIDYGNDSKQRSGRYPTEKAFQTWVRKECPKELPSDIARGTGRAVYKIFVKKMRHWKVSELPPEEPSMHLDHVQLDILANVIRHAHIGKIDLDVKQTKVWPMKWKGREGKLKSSPLWRFLTDGKFRYRSGNLRQRNGNWYFILSFTLDPSVVPLRDKGTDPRAGRITAEVRELFEACDDDRLHVADIAAVIGSSVQIVGKALADRGIKSRNISISGKQGRGYDRSTIEVAFADQETPTAFSR